MAAVMAVVWIGGMPNGDGEHSEEQGSGEGRNLSHPGLDVAGGGVVSGDFSEDAEGEGGDDGEEHHQAPWWWNKAINIHWAIADRITAAIEVPFRLAYLVAGRINMSPIGAAMAAPLPYSDPDR